MLAASRSRLKIAPLVVIVLAGSLPQMARASVTLPGNVTVREVDFERHLMGLFGRMGCNAGSCHGSFQGKNGFRLSLFGYDPAKDYTTLTRDNLGRRLNPVDPDRSLVLLKATGQIQHGGGRRFARGSWQYQLFREWIARGAPWHKGSGDVADLIVSPAESAIIQPRQTGRIHVRARFADGSVEDVTALCDFRTQDDAVAEITAPGVVKALQSGDTALVVSYRGNVRALRVLVPMPVKSGFRYPKVPVVNYIDREVFAKLRRLNMVPADLAGDAEFLRRVTIDTIGCLPTPEEARTFLADKDPRKRAKKIDELLAHPMHAALWATKFSDITGNNTTALPNQKGPLQARYSQMWHDWFRKRIADNVPYDEIVRGVLCATSRDGKSAEEWLEEVKQTEQAAQTSFVTPYANRASLDLFWLIGRNPTLEQMGERTAAAFLGIRLECAQCHKHPFDRWSQADYRAFANVFGQVKIGASQEVLTLLKQGKVRLPVKGKKGKGPGVFEVFVANFKVRGLPDPDVPQVVLGVGKKNRPILQPVPPVPPKALGGPRIPLENDKDARLTLFEWMRSPDNPYFARSFVNRVWGHYFGVGLVDPVDNFSLANPPSNARLLDALARDFITHKYDIRQLERVVLNARTYQLASEINDTNRLDRNNYSHSYLRPMMAEVVVDVLNSALGVTEYFGPETPPGCRAIEVGSSRVPSYAFRVFGRPLRTAACDCERASEPALPQTLYLMTDPEVLNKLRMSALPLSKLKPFQIVTRPKTKGQKGAFQLLPRQEGRLAKLLQGNRTEDEILEELFLATLTRFPSAAEKKHFAAYREARKPPAPPPEETPKQKRIREKNRAQFALTERAAVLVDALWALINTREFILNH